MATAQATRLKKISNIIHYLMGRQRHIIKRTIDSALVIKKVDHTNPMSSAEKWKTDGDSPRFFLQQEAFQIF